MANSSRDKLKVFGGILSAWVLSTVFIAGGYELSVSKGWFSGYTIAEILSLTLLLAGLSLILGIGRAAQIRHFKQNIDGSAPTSGSSLDITLRYVRNTTEQLVLFFIMLVCLSGAAPQLVTPLFPILGVWFFLARMLFWAGYLRSPLSRAVGFASTFHPIIFFFILAGIALLT